MLVEALLAEVDVRAVHGPAVDVTSLTSDSHRVAPGALFCCVRGVTTDGHRFAPDAVARGAVALLVDHHLDLDVTQVEVDDTRVATGRVAAAFFGHPSRAMDVVGITGTNGKTTTAWFLTAILRADGRPVEMIGTLTSRPDGPPTTPAPIELQELLAAMRDRGVRAVAMEVSSHALAQSRVEGMSFAVGIFTSFGRDHLDFHGTVERYFAAKARLLEPGRSAVAVVNADDPALVALIAHPRIPTRAYSLGDVDDLVLGATSTGTWRGHRLVVPLPGSFNVSNALAAATAAVELGVDEVTAVEGIASASQAPGRFEVVVAQPCTVIVDYAHTPDALDNLLREARRLTDGRVVVVFGCGGDKDRGKRPLMGEVAARLADVVVLTSDNPRSEDPLAIIGEIQAGASAATALEVEPDRRAAITLALDAAAPGDVVVVAGKGHEDTQTIGERILPFDDRAVVREVLAG